MSEELIGKVFNNRYEITERIGIGGMAEVYRAQDNVLGRVVAVKVMLPQYAADEGFTKRFRQEAASAANLQSPYIVNVYDWGQDSGKYYIVMEYIRGSDLKTAIKQRGAINQRKVAEIASQVCQALSVAHALDIVHRDIKPQNIMVQPDGNVKVMDFGIARAKNSVNGKTSSVLGTAHYISPEQAQGKDLTQTSDIYSLGVVMYEACTGKLPFDGPDAISVATKQVQETPVAPREINPEVDPTLEAIILKAMAKDPNARFATAKDMRTILNDYLAGRPVSLDSGFTNAQTQVMGAVPFVAPIPVGGDSTEVMNPVNGNSAQTQGKSFDSKNKQPKNNRKKAAIILGIIAAIALFVVIGFATGLFGGSSEQIEVPNVVGQTQDSAANLLQASGFKVSVEQSYSDSVEKGKVISQDPTSGSKKAKGTTVKITVSQGATQVEVPDLTGKTADEAKNLLKAAGLKYQAGQSEYSESVEKDHVTRQDVAAGSMVAKDTTVTYYLSLGSEGVSVPDVRGVSEGSALATLKNAGFAVTTEYQASTSVEQGCVKSQTPSAGTKQKAGATINLVISKGKTTHTVTASAGSGGSVTPSSTSVNDGSSATFTVTPNSGYQVASVSDNYGASYSVNSSGGSFTINNVTTDTSITVTFTQTQSSNNNNNNQNSGSSSNNNSSSGGNNNSNNSSQNGQSSNSGGNTSTNSTSQNGY